MENGELKMENCVVATVFSIFNFLQFSPFFSSKFEADDTK